MAGIQAPETREQPPSAQISIIAHTVTLGDTNNNKGDEVMGNQYKLEQVNNNGNPGEGNTRVNGRHNNIAPAPARASVLNKAVTWAVDKIKGAR